MGLVSSCQNNIVFKFPKEEIQSLSVYTYDFSSGVTTTNWIYKKDDMQDFLYYFENIRGTRIESIDTENLRGPFFGIELHTKNPYYILFSGDCAITYDGEYYLIDGNEAEKMCQSIIGDTKVYNDVSHIVNHRYLSLIKGNWDTKYMVSTKFTGEQIKNVHLLGEKISIDIRELKFGLTIVNNTRNTIEFGSKLALETLINDEWYSIDNMINDNVNLTWTDILYQLGSGKSQEDKFYLKYYQPLPIGRYRLVKQVTTYGSTGYVAYEFDVK
jgi:hypothetical protein